MVAAVALTLMGCLPTAFSPETEASRHRWGSAAIELIEAHAEAVCSQDVYSVAPFHDIDVIADYRALTLGRFPGQLREGRHQMIAFLDLCLFSPTSEIEVDIIEVFLHPAGAVTIERWTDPGMALTPPSRWG